MAYTKQSFTDHVKDANGNVVQRGTLIKKEHLDHMEDGIYQAHEQLARKLSAPASPQVGDYLRIKSIAADGTMVVEGVPAPEAALPERPTFRDVSLVPQSDQNAGATLVPEGTAERPKVGLYGCHGNEPVELCNVAEATADQSAPNLAQVREMISIAMDGTIVPAGSVTLTENGDYDVTQYANAEVAIPEVQQALPEITVNQDTGSIGYKITQEEGYVAGGTKFGSQTQPTQSAKTVTPGVSAKTAVAKGVFTTGEVKVAGDSNLVGKNIKKGITLFGVEGSLPEEIEAESLNEVHQWEKYTVDSIAKEEVANELLSLYMSISSNNPWDPVDYADEIEIVDGALQLINPTTITLDDSTTSRIVGKYIRAGINGAFYEIPSDASVIYHNTSTGGTVDVNKAYKLTGVVGGELVGVVLSEDIEAYPADGEQDGYRYVYIGTLENTGSSGGGENGATFTPALAENGDLSWSNDKGLPNPATVNIKGPQGDPGGYYAPVVTQPSENMLQFGWTQSKSDMPSRPPVAFELPSGVTNEQVAAAIDARIPDIINGLHAKIPVVGVVDTENNITIYGDLESGTYTLRYENADGATTEIGSLTVEQDEEPDGDTTEKTLTGIAVEYSGGSVPAGTAVSALTGVVVTATYDDGSTATVTGYTLSGTIAEGSNTITVSYGGKTATFTVTGISDSAIVSLAPAFTEWAQNSVAGTAEYALGSDYFEVVWEKSGSGNTGALMVEVTGLEAGRTVAIDVDISSSTGSTTGMGFSAGPSTSNVSAYAEYATQHTEFELTSDTLGLRFKVSSSSYTGGYPVTINVSNFRVYYVDGEVA